MMRRNSLIPKVICIMPLMVMLVMPLVANLDVKRVQVAVVDNAHNRLSRRLIQNMSAAGALEIYAVCVTFYRNHAGYISERCNFFRLGN